LGFIGPGLPYAVWWVVCFYLQPHFLWTPGPTWGGGGRGCRAKNKRNVVTMRDFSLITFTISNSYIIHCAIQYNITTFYMFSISCVMYSFKLNFIIKNDFTLCILYFVQNNSLEVLNFGAFCADIGNIFVPSYTV
jgi:hypothetical protein